MTDKKISQLTDATTPLAGTEVLPLVQSGSTVKVSVANLTAGRTVDATTVNATTVDATNVEVTNVKAKDGTAALSIADSTGAVTVFSGSILNGGIVVNEDGADVDFRVESDTNTHALFVDAGNSRVGIGTSTPSKLLTIAGDFLGGEQTFFSVSATLAPSETVVFDIQNMGFLAVSASRSGASNNFLRRIYGYGGRAAQGYTFTLLASASSGTGVAFSIAQSGSDAQAVITNTDATFTSNFVIKGINM